MREEIVEKDLVYAINACVFEVYRQLGHGFLERLPWKRRCLFP